MLGRAVVGSSHRSRGSSVSAPTSILREPEVPVYRFDHLRVPLLQSRGQRTVHDEELRAEVSRVRTENYSVYGAHKVWLEMRSEGIDVARCTIDGCLRARMRTKRHAQGLPRA
ncbi:MULTISPECIES: IS3 family transposase [Rhodococcus]|uniref:IS3 family transposase n=1 Tax=Rhodococcus TaxID=1827 RepID=UPI0037BCFCAF